MLPRKNRRIIILLAAALLAGCGQPALVRYAPLVPLRGRTAVAAQASALASPAACTGTFAAHDLDHTTAAPARIARMFEGNGSGVAIDDLDGDGRPEVVLANSYGPNTILWNQGGLHFRTERMPQGDARAVNIVDVDGDGRPDMVFTRRQAAPAYWRNTGDPAARFVQTLLPNVARPAYAMAWGDLDGDGALDLVAGSYDAELLTSQGTSFLLGPGAGVYAYTRSGTGFAPSKGFIN